MLSLVTNVFLVIPACPWRFTGRELRCAGRMPVAIVIVLHGLGLGRAGAAGADALDAQARVCRAARASGEGTLRIIFFDIFPNQLAIVAPV